MTRIRKPRRSALAAVACLTLAATLGACGLDSSAGGDGDEDEIVIGVSLPLTGDFSEPGKGVQRGYEAWEAWTNENGGLLACPCESDEGSWKVFVQLEGVSFDDGCLGFDALTSNSTQAGAWQYS